MWRPNSEAKMKVLGFHLFLAVQEGNYFQWRWNEHDEWKIENSHGHTVSQTCQAKLGMTKRVREGSVTFDDYDAQALDVARQVGTGLFMIRIDHLIRDDNASNPLLNDLVIDLGDEFDVDHVDRDSDQSNSSDCFTHAMVNARCGESPTSVLQAHTSIVSCGLASFERTSWSAQRCPKFWGSYDELATEADYDKFVCSLMTNTLVCATVVQHG